MISTITNISITPKYIYSNKVNNHLPLRNNADTISFCSRNLLTKKSNEITDTILEVIKNKANFIGEGCEGNVYKIPDTNYCVKLFKKEPLDFGEWNLNIKPYERVNHVLAKAENNAVIMRYIDGIPFHKVKNEIDKVPEKSIRNLIIQVANANDEAMMFDGASSNIIYNPKDKSLKAIDFYADYIDEFSTARPLSQIFASLSLKANTDEAKAINRRLGGKMLNIILGEITKERLPEFPVDKVDMNRLLNKIRYSQSFNTPPQFEFLVKSMNRIMDLKSQRGKYTNCTNEIKGEEKYSKCIINQCLIGG